MRRSFDRLRHRIASALIRLLGGNRAAPMPAPAE
jgi:hypothetical protein